MTEYSRIASLLRRARRTVDDERGAVSVEFAVVVALLFFLFFVLLDFGILAFSQVLAEKATHIAARTAVVRPAACSGVPEINARGGAASAPRFGTSCDFEAGVCADPGTISCTGDATNSTALEIWNRIDTWLPSDAQISDITFTYEFDPAMGFLGGPYTPVVTVDIDLPDYQFISPLGALAVAAGASGAPVGSSFQYPTFSVSLPAEDLAQGGAG